MLNSTLEEYSEKDDHGEHNQNCTDMIKKGKACRGRWETFKRIMKETWVFPRLSGQVRVQQRCRSRKVHMGLGNLPVFSKQQDRQGVAGVCPGRERSDWESPFGSHKDLAIILEGAFEEFSGLGSTKGSN